MSDKVKMYLQVYPLGWESRYRGSVSVLIHLEGLPAESSLRARLSLKMEGKGGSFNTSTETTFGSYYYLYPLCKSALVLESPIVNIELEVAILEYNYKDELGVHKETPIGKKETVIV